MNSEIEARILASPDDETAYLVYGDWLSERGDPRGELVTVQVALEKNPKDAALARGSTEIIAANPQWLGELPNPYLEVWWRYGFLSRVRFGPPTTDYVEGGAPHDAAHRALMDLPGIAFIREITFGSFKDEVEYTPSWDTAVSAVAERGVPRGLRALSLHRGGFWDISSTSVTNLPDAYPALEELERLEIELGHVELGELALPSLRALRIVTGGLTSDDVRSIAKASWPALEELTLYLGDTTTDYGCDVTPEHIEDLLESPSLARVRRLGIKNSNHADAIAELVARAPITGQLESLDLGCGALSDAGAAALMKNAAALAHLSRLDCSLSYLSEEVAQNLKRALPNAVVEDQRKPYDSGTRVYRFVTIAE